MIYTTYFAKLKKLPDNIIPISICAKAPYWYTGLQYKKLAPKYDFFMKWKETHDNDYYIKCFNEQVLRNLNVENVLMELYDIVNGSYVESMRNHEDIPPLCDIPKFDIALVCYEKPEDFCHRHLVADWLIANGHNVKEYK